EMASPVKTAGIIYSRLRQNIEQSLKGTRAPGCELDGHCQKSPYSLLIWGQNGRFTTSRTSSFDSHTTFVDSEQRKLLNYHCFGESLLCSTSQPSKFFWNFLDIQTSMYYED